MQVRSINEGGSIELEPKYIDIAKDIKLKRPDLPFFIEGYLITFEDYIVGELVLQDISIKLNPRNKAFNLNGYFQIVCYLHDIEQTNDIGTGFSDGTDIFSFSSLSANFCTLCLKLLQFGLTGSYISSEETSMKLNGDINFSHFYPQTIPLTGIPIITREYSIDTPQNQLIKSALQKLCLIESTQVNSVKFQILRDLNLVSECAFEKSNALPLLDGFYSPNPWYINALDLSIKILFDLELEYSNGSIEWMAFLENTNSLFEAYIRKVLSDNLDEKITKWEKPRQFIKMRNNSQIGEKSFSPDILINFSENTTTAEAIIDVKNKTFEPSSLRSLDMLCSTGDLYQLIFYCNQLKARVGGLIYPSSTTNEPIELMMDSQSGLKIFLFSINMNENFSFRNKKISNEIYHYLMREV
jgi:5-methylcytosine-specific restriction endonuclease McrBC regulatory subunit McrC